MTGAMLIPPYNAVRTQQTILQLAEMSFSDWFITYRNMHTGFNFIRGNFSRLNSGGDLRCRWGLNSVCAALLIINNQCPPNKQFEENQYLASRLNDRTESVNSLSSGGVQSITPEYQRYPTSENHEIAHDC